MKSQFLPCFSKFFSYLFNNNNKPIYFWIFNIVLFLQNHEKQKKLKTYSAAS